MKMEAKIVLYAQKGNQRGNDLTKMITSLILKENMEIFDTISGLSSRLRKPQCESAIVILLVSDGEDLERIINIRPFLGNVRIILVLPDDHADTVRIGHSLHPRYISFKDGPLTDVVSVLAKMIEMGKPPDTAFCGRSQDCPDNDKIIKQP